MLVTPVGPYFKTGFKPCKICLSRQYDRVAPKGTGAIKIGGNYAASLAAGEKAHELGFAVMLYLDPKDKKYIDECGAANFFAIKGNSYITPLSDTVLPSITNLSLRTLAEDMGLEVEHRLVPYEELDSFEEAGNCGTAAVISPIGEIADLDTGKRFIYCKDGKAGPKSTALYNQLRGIQYGEVEDTHGWCEVFDESD